ncbi:helix-turn-helix domain-containing protein [Dactylosporangium sp. NPDC048998]|uniref:helix-turn-helix domain-containing protein n=1 Tax=Dactylosporangium sp. NPDC048998 TaxID=3363976 RepID=UPI00371D5DE7
MSLKDWEARVLAAEGAAERVSEVEEELRLAAGLTALRERAGLSQAEVAARIGVSQPRVAAIERSSNITLDLLERYVGALLPGGGLEIFAVQGRRRFPLLAPPATGTARAGGGVRKAATAARRSAATTRKAAAAARVTAAARKKAT